MKRGYRVLFYGSPGTGKTLTASLLGKQFNKDVYRIDLSQVVSKFIGETEKEPGENFRQGRKQKLDPVLSMKPTPCLGSAAVFPTHTITYANQEVNYLLQRIEDFPGLIVLLSNFKNNIDQAFLRRFNAINLLSHARRCGTALSLEKMFPETVALQADVNLKAYADKYEFSGSAISNIMQYASLYAMARQNGGITGDDIG